MSIIYHILDYAPCMGVTSRALNTVTLSPNTLLLKRLGRSLPALVQTPRGTLYSTEMVVIEETILRLQAVPGWYIFARTVEWGRDVYLCVDEDMKHVAERTLGKFFASCLLSELQG